MTKKKARKTLCCQGCSGQLTLNEAATSETLTAYMRAAGHGDYNGAWCDKCRPPASPDEKAAVRLAQQPKPDPGNPWQREGSLHELRLDWESYSGDRHKHLCDRYPNWATIDYFGRKVLGREKWTQETWNELEKWLIATGHAKNRYEAKFLPAARVAELLRQTSGGGETSKQAVNNPPVLSTVATDDTPGVISRNRKFVQWYEAKGTNTYHQPKQIWKKWDTMKMEERAAICPTRPNKISPAAVAQAIKRTIKACGGERKAGKAKKTRKQNG